MDNLFSYLLQHIIFTPLKQFVDKYRPICLSAPKVNFWVLLQYFSFYLEKMKRGCFGSLFLSWIPPFFSSMSLISDYLTKIEKQNLQVLFLIASRKKAAVPWIHETGFLPYCHTPSILKKVASPRNLLYSSFKDGGWVQDGSWVMRVSAFIETTASVSEEKHNFAFLPTTSFSLESYPLVSQHLELGFKSHCFYFWTHSLQHDPNSDTNQLCKT